MRRFILAVLTLLVPSAAHAQQGFYSHDNYTQYELLEPSSGSFAITYYVTERRPGSIYLLNQTRSGSAGSDISVFDPQTGKPLKFDYLSGAELSASGMTGRFDPKEHYIRAHLPRPVPEKGEGRVKILKTYQDAKSYFPEGDDIVFKRSLGIARNSIVLPKGYRLVASNVAAQMFTLPDGRLKISFEHAHGYAADVTVRARPSGALPESRPLPPGEQALNWTKTLYDLQADPLGGAVTHEFVEEKPGSEVSLVRPIELGREFTVTDVDSGLPLTVSRRGTRTVAVLKTHIFQGGSARLRVTGPMRAESVIRTGDTLEWTGMPVTARLFVLLPAGWDVLSVSVPATVATQSDGRVGIQIYNQPPLLSKVSIRAVKR
jgi:hypothetical protein